MDLQQRGPGEEFDDEIPVEVGGNHRLQLFDGMAAGLHLAEQRVHLADMDGNGIADLVLFTPATYFRLFELYHRDWWPVQLASLVMAVVILLCLWLKPARGGRLIAILLANRFLPRFWCRTLCPLGALLGVLSRRARW